MQAAPRYDDVVSEVAAFEERAEHAVAEGVRRESICVDPGIGFGKTPTRTSSLVRRLDVLVGLGYPVLGLSRKSTLGKVLGDPEATTGTVAASVGGAVAARARRLDGARARRWRDRRGAAVAARSNGKVST